MRNNNLLILRSAFDLGGAEKYLLNLLLGLKERGFCCFVISDLPDLIQEIQNKNLAETKFMTWGREMWTKKDKIIFLFSFPLNFLKFFFLFTFLKTKKKIDLVFCQSLNDKMIATLAAKILGLKIVWIEHGPVFGYLTSFKPLIWFYRLNSSFVDRIIVVSKATLENLLKIGISKEKLILIYNGIETKKFKVSSKEKAKIKKEFNLENHSVIGNVSRLILNKGQEYLIEVAKEVLNSYPSVKFLLVGEGPDRRFLEKEIEKQGLREKIILVGFRKDIEKILSVFDIFVYPPYCLTEGLPFSIIEAEAAGKPVIVTNVGGCKEALKDKKTGFLIEAKDKKALLNCLLKLLENKKLREEMGKQGKKFAQERFDLNKMIKKTRHLFLEILKEK